MKTGLLFITSIMVLALAGCQKTTPNTPFLPSDHPEIAAEIESMVWAFYEADTSMNAAKAIGLLWPECQMFIDGRRITFDEMKVASKLFMRSLRIYKSQWTDLKIMPVSGTVAISSFIFQDSLVTNMGDITQSRGPNTFVWQKRNEEWRIVYVDADHYPFDQAKTP